MTAKYIPVYWGVLVEIPSFPFRRIRDVILTCNKSRHQSSIRDLAINLEIK